MRRRVCQLLVLVLLLAGCTPGKQGPRRLTILHTNDLHARFLPDANGSGGFAELATAIRREIAESERTLVVNAGDLVQGTPVSSIFKGGPCYEVANAMGIDVSTLGNHEFDYGWREILEFTNTAKFPIVSANVKDADGKLLAKEAYIIREVGGIRVAIIGALTETLPSLTRESQRGPWRALPVADTVREYASELSGRSDLIVVLGHLTDQEDDAILRSVPQVQVTVSGHNHSGQKEAKELDGRLVVKTEAYGREFGRLDLEVDMKAKRIAGYQWRRVPVNKGAYEPDPTVAAQVKKWEDKVASLVDVPIGEARRDIPPKEAAGIIEAAMSHAVGADLAYMNRGGVRDGFPKGRLLARHAWNVMPFDNTIVYGKIRGKDLPEEASRGRQIELEREYLFATNDFIADQWKRTGPRFSQEGPGVRDALINWIKKKKVLE